MDVNVSIDTSQCGLCFFSLDETGGENISCANPNCASKMCVDCLGHLIHYSSENKSLPCCPVKTCGEIYYFSDVQKNKQKILPAQYKKACFDFFLQSDGDSIEKQILEREIIEKIRAEKLEFLEKSFPEAVGLVARISFKHKLNKINEKKKELVHLKVSGNKKKCFFQSCTGFLDELDEVDKVLVCLLCENHFCKLCEKELDKEDAKKHECDQNDIESLNIVNGMTRCPGCNLPVFKNVGCDFITCSSCSVSFHYKTGERTNHGSVNLKIQLAPEQRLLSALYRSELEEKQSMELMLTIESLRPLVVSKNIILYPIHRFIKTSYRYHRPDPYIRQKHENEVACNLEKYTRYKHESKKYVQTMLKIEKYFQKRDSDSTEKVLKAALEDICSKK